MEVKIKKGESIDIWDNGMPTRDFVYVKDVVDATLLAIDNDITNYLTQRLFMDKNKMYIKA